MGKGKVSMRKGGGERGSSTDAIRLDSKWITGLRRKKEDNTVKIGRTKREETRKGGEDWEKKEEKVKLETVSSKKVK